MALAAATTITTGCHAFVPPNLGISSSSATTTTTRVFLFDLKQRLSEQRSPQQQISRHRIPEEELYYLSRGFGCTTEGDDNSEANNIDGGDPLQLPYTIHLTSPTHITNGNIIENKSASRLLLRHLEVEDIKLILPEILREFGAIETSSSSSTGSKLGDEAATWIENFLFSFTVLVGLDQRVERRKKGYSASANVPPDHNVICLVEVTPVTNKGDATTTTTTTSAPDNNTNEDSLISLSSFVNEPEGASMIRPLSTTTTTTTKQQEATLTTPQNKRNNQLLTTATLTVALLIQATSTTFLTVLWPLLSKDLFSLSAHTFGILTFLSSIVSTGAVASFPIVEGMEKVGGRVRCAALGFGIGAISCFLFCYCSFGGVLVFSGGVELDLTAVGSSDILLVNEVSNGSDRFLLEDGKVQQQLRSRNRLLWHAISAILFQSALCFLEPSLKSILSLSVSSSSIGTRSKKGSSSLGFTMGYLTMLGNVGGMIGNIAGTWMYKLSTETTTEVSRFGQGGSLPFLVTGVLLSISSVMIWRLDEPPANIAAFDSRRSNHDNATQYNETEDGMDLELGSSTATDNDASRLESVEAPDEETSDGCCLTLRETTYDLKLD